MIPSSPDSRRTLLRLSITAGVGLLVTLLVVQGAAARPGAPTDFDQVWFAARAILDGRDPYQLIGPGREFDWPYPLFYPLPAALAILPLAFLDALPARVVFLAVPSMLLAWRLSRDDLSRLTLFISGAFVVSVFLVQWSPALTVASVYPAAGFLLAAKPNLGLVVVAGQESLRSLAMALGSAAMVMVASFVVQPSWFSEWRDAVMGATHFVSYLSVPGGVLLLAAALRWRRAEARMLLVLAVVPHTPGVATMLPLFLARWPKERLALLAVLTYLASFLVPGMDEFATPGAYTRAVARFTLYTALLPALVIALVQPNEWDGARGPADGG